MIISSQLKDYQRLCFRGVPLASRSCTESARGLRHDAYVVLGLVVEDGDYEGLEDPVNFGIEIGAVKFLLCTHFVCVYIISAPPLFCGSYSLA